MATNLVQNCNFEIGSPQKNGADYPNAIVSSWTSLGSASSGTFERGKSSVQGYTATDSTSHLELQVNSSTSIQQLRTTTAGAEYALDFWAAYRPRDRNGFSAIDVYVNSSVLMSTDQITTPYR
ncbi:hypothetical protein [Gemmatimonas sp.]|jgi:hypothetical protein|uniref:hypothetical protein n=1 Tax=Gemmatimonas sp. TaxID=1962908 RepID=UPI0031BD9F03|nr:hypothetical protein [Gemmatimonas sp.]